MRNHASGRDARSNRRSFRAACRADGFGCGDVAEVVATMSDAHRHDANAYPCTKADPQHSRTLPHATIAKGLVELHR
jgi:hypothetical protein